MTAIRWPVTITSNDDAHAFRVVTADPDQLVDQLGKLDSDPAVHSSGVHVLDARGKVVVLRYGVPVIAADYDG